jgi:glycolate oxidase subunit GlcD
MFEELEAIVGGENLTFAREDLEVYARDSSFFCEVPICVVRPKTTAEIVDIIKLAEKENIPIIPRGAGTNPCGEVVGKAIILDLSRMDGIIEINPKDMYAVVEPGVVRDNLNSKLKEFGLFFPPDPASSKVATIGGMVSNNSSGLHAVKYGTTKDYVLALEIVLPTGELIETGTLALKSSSGYDLNRLFVGSEGTLGVFTRITLHLLPIPQHSRTLTFTIDDFDDLESLQNMVLPLMPAAFEFLDEICKNAISKKYDLDLGNVKGILVIEFAGSETEVEQGIEELKKQLNGGVEIPNIWEIRKGIVPLLSTHSHKRPLAITEDIGVPISKNTSTIRRIKDIYNSTGYEVAIYGHLGDGNLHMRVFGDLDSRLQKAADEVYSYVISIDGTISSEHGIGRLRTKYMEKAHGKTLELMKRIKETIDGKGIFNPGCMFEG